MPTNKIFYANTGELSWEKISTANKSLELLGMAELHNVYWGRYLTKMKKKSRCLPALALQKKLKWEGLFLQVFDFLTKKLAEE